MIWVAVFSASVAMLAAAFTLFVTAPWLRHKLDVVQDELALCEKQRIELRRQLQIIVSALVGLLPETKRVALLLDLDRQVSTASDGEEA